MGKHNSSLTRVRPFFRSLLERDKTGKSWLPKLLALAPRQDALTKSLGGEPGDLTRVDLDPERRLYPTAEFLHWLIMNPNKLTWPADGRRKYGQRTQELREQWFAGSEEARSMALRLLAREGVAKSERKWWAFEGCTFSDCYLETERFKLYIEGKRTETLSAETDWYPARNQLLRNLESARGDARGKSYGCLLIVEKPEPELTQDQIEQGLPHLTFSERSTLLSHFLGVVTWKEACEATAISYDALPDVVESTR